MFNKMKICNDFLLQNNYYKIAFNKHLWSNINSKESLKIMISLINQTKHGPASLIHALILSKILHRCVRVWHKGRMVFTFGKPNEKIQIDLVFKECLKEVNGSLRVGHWTLLSDNDSPSNNNNCFYQAIAWQTGIDPFDLRLMISREIRKNSISISKLISNSVDPQAMINVMLGGASYYPPHPELAKRILNDSQQGRSHPDGSKGHPRGHAYSLDNGDLNVQTYSFSRWRSGFLSRQDQDLVCHYSLITDSARNLMDKLNDGSLKLAIHIKNSEIDYDPLPMGQIWSNGERIGNAENFRFVCFVGKHFLNQHNNIDSNIFILTFYPIL